MPDAESIDLRYLSRFLTPIYSQPLIRGWVESYLRALNPLDEAAASLFTLTDIDASVGRQLDVLSRIVGALRRPGDDALTRILVKTEIRARRSSGAGDDLIQILDIIYPGDGVEVAEIFPAGLLVGPVYDVTLAEATLVFGTLDRSRAAAVGLGFLWSPVPETDTFAFAEGATPEADTDLGFADADNPGTGGQLVGIL